MILELVAVFALGALTGFGELIGRYQDEPMRAVAQLPGAAYLLINALAAVGAFGVIRAFDWRFGLAADASDAALSTLQVLVAGLAAAALFRSSVFTARVGDQDVRVGPSAVLDVLLRTVDRAVDRRRAVARLAVVGDLPSDLSFERDAITLAAYATASLQNVSLAEAETLGNEGNALRLRDDVPDTVKMRMFALELMVLVGEEGLRTAIAQLKQATPPEVATDEEPEPVVEAPEEAVEEAEPIVPPASGVTPARVAPSNHSGEELERLIQTLEQVVQLSPDLAESWLALGRARARLANVETSGRLFLHAADAINGALTRRPTFADAHLELGRVQTAWPYNKAEAESRLRTALRFAEAPEIEAAIDFQLAVLMSVRGRPLLESARWLEQCIATGAAAPECRIACASIHVLLSDTALATAQMEAAVEAHPDYGPGWVLLGLLRNAAADVDAAAQALARAGELLDLEAEVAHVRRVGEGVAYQRVGNAAAAVDTLGAALTDYLPGVSDVRWWTSSFGNGEQAPWHDLQSVATTVYKAVLVTHLGAPVIRGTPVAEGSAPVAEEASA